MLLKEIEKETQDKERVQKGEATTNGGGLEEHDSPMISMVAPPPEGPGEGDVRMEEV